MITAKQAHELIARMLAPDNLVLMDAGYSLPAKDWVIGDFSNALAADLSALGVLEYLPESNDCDKFAWAAVFIARLCNERTQVGRALAFGMLLYRRDVDGKGHAINVVVTGTAQQPELLFYEPQTRREVSLTEAERMSCWCVIM